MTRLGRFGVVVVDSDRVLLPLIIELVDLVDDSSVVVDVVVGVVVVVDC